MFGPMKGHEERLFRRQPAYAVEPGGRFDRIAIGVQKEPADGLSGRPVVEQGLEALLRLPQDSGGDATDSDKQGRLRCGSSRVPVLIELRVETTPGEDNEDAAHVPSVATVPWVSSAAPTRAACHTSGWGAGGTPGSEVVSLP